MLLTKCLIFSIVPRHPDYLSAGTPPRGNVDLKPTNRGFHMNNTVITGEKIFEALKRDPSFIAETPESSHGVWREVCDQIPQLLADHLDQPVTVDSLFRMKMKVLRFLLDGDWMQRMIKTYPKEMLGGFDFSDLLEMLIPTMRSMIEQLEEIIGDDINAWLETQGITEEIFLAHPKGGHFTESTFTQWKKGGFTIADLLVKQPNTIFKNTD